MKTCEYPICPCQDGDQCLYETYYETYGHTRGMDPREPLLAHIAELSQRAESADAKSKEWHQIAIDRAQKIRALTHKIYGMEHLVKDLKRQLATYEGTR